MEPQPPPPPRRGLRVAAGVAALLLLSVPTWLLWRDRAQEERAREAFGPALEAIAPEPSPRYDIDKTVRVIHEIDQAIENSQDLEDWLDRMAHQDYREVAPDVLAARREILDILMRLYANQTALKDQEALWEFSGGMMALTAMSIVDVQGEVGPTALPSGSLSVDQRQAQKLLGSVLDNIEERERITGEINAVESELLQAMVKYSEVYYQHIEEWDRLCVLRDRAYLAAWNGSWGEAITAADAAISLAPTEREAHLLKALALIESGERGREASELLATYLEDHPDASAPALLLLGVLHSRAGDEEQARLALQQAAAEYPRQAEHLSDMLDPYKARSYLRKSQEGSYILELYRSAMLGAGYFSPDLQLARAAFERGDREEGRAKVLDHFRRRSNQGQWDFILSDLEFCQELLGEDYQRLFPEDFYLDLLTGEALIGDELKVSVNNRTDRVLHNATLVLALHLTDMYPGDYETLIAGETRPELPPHKVTDFGAAEIRFDLFGQQKGPDDVIDTRAILVSDEAVVWVDTENFKIQQLASQPIPPPGTPAPGSSPEERALISQVTDALRVRSTLSVTRDLLKDDLTFQLPRELLWLRPFFQLSYGGSTFSATENLLVGDSIQLRFADVGDFEGATDIELTADTPIGALLMAWRLGADGTARLLDIRLD